MFSSVWWEPIRQSCLVSTIISYTSRYCFWITILIITGPLLNIIFPSSSWPYHAGNSGTSILCDEGSILFADNKAGDARYSCKCHNYDCEELCHHHHHHHHHDYECCSTWSQCCHCLYSNQRGLWQASLKPCVWHINHQHYYNLDVSSLLSK